MLKDVDSIKQFLKEQGFHDSIALSTLLDALYNRLNWELASRVDRLMEEMNVPAVTRVSTFIARLSDEGGNYETTDEKE